jgi:hypothetical protein
MRDIFVIPAAVPEDNSKVKDFEIIIIIIINFRIKNLTLF